MKKRLLYFFAAIILSIPITNLAQTYSRATGTFATASTWNQTRTGTITVTNGSTSVTGSGTTFSTSLAAADVLVDGSGNVLGTVLTITDDTNLILTSNASSSYTGSFGREKIPGNADDVIIQTGHTVTVGATASVKGLTVQSSALLIGSGTISAPLTFRIYGTTATIAGTVGNGSGSSAASLNIEFQNNLTFTGSGTLSVSRIRSYSTAPAYSCTFDMDAKVWYQGYALQGYEDGASYTINAGKTLTFAPGSSLGSGSGSAGLAGSVTVNVYGTIDLSAATTCGLNLKTTTAGKTGTLYISSGGLVKVGGNFQLTNASDLGAGVLTIDNGGSLQLGGSVDFGVATLTLNGTLTYNGSLAQNTGALPSTLNNLVINNSAGVTLGGPIAVAGTLTLTSGNLTTDATNLLTVSGTGTISGGSSSSYVDGPLAFSYATALGAFSKTYPIGKGGIYRPLTLSLTQTDATASTYTAEMFNSAPAANALPGTLDKVSLVRYYTISEDGGGSAFTLGAVTLSYDTDDGVTDNTTLRIAKDDGAGNWVDLGGSGASPITSTIAFTSLSVFTLANATGGTNPLPVELTSFTASANGSQVNLAWTTATEVNNYGFEILRSAQNDKWEKIGFVNGNGNSNSPKNYSFTDEPKGGREFKYRLKQIDFDGKFEYSDVVTVNVAAPASFSVKQNYPNPFNPTTTIKYELPANSLVTIKVYDVIGREIATLLNGNETAGYHEVNFDGKNLSSGMYFYKVQAGNYSQIKKMLLVK